MLSVGIDGETHDAETGEVFSLDDIEGEFVDKIAACAFVRTDYLAMAAAAKDAARKMSERAARLTARADRISAMVQECMAHAGKNKVTTPCATVSVRKGSTSVVVDDADALPDSMVVIKRAPDKTAIKKALSSGGDVPGAHLAAGPDGLTWRM